MHLPDGQTLRPGPARTHDDPNFEIQLDSAPAPAWAEHIDRLIFRDSIAMEEIVLLLRSSGTIFGDLIENL